MYPPGISKSYVDPNNEQAEDEPSLMDHGEQIPPVMSYIRETTKKDNVSVGMHQEKILLKVDKDAIKSFIETYAHAICGFIFEIG